MKILIWNQGRALGDGIMFSGYPREIKKLYPNAVLDVVCTKTHAQALKNNPFINKIYFFKTYLVSRGGAKQEKIIQFPLFQLRNLLKIRSEKYDYIIDTSSSCHWGNLFMIKFISKNHKCRVAGAFPPINKCNKSKTELAKIYTDMYDTGYSYQVFGITNTPKYELFIDQKKEDVSNNYYKNYKKNNENKIIIFNGEGSGPKSLSSDKIISTVKALLEMNENILIFFLGYAPKLDKYELISEKINSPRTHITYKTDFFDTAALIKHANLLISVDTSLIHVASAVGTKVVNLYSQNIKGYQPGIPKFVKYKSINQTLNMDKADPNGYRNEDVVAAAKELLQI